MTKEQLEDALDFNPFEGDFGSCGDRTLKNKIVKFRKSHICHICDGETKSGEIGRSLVEVFEGEIGSFYFCHDCCVAMAESMYGDGEDDDSEEEYCDPLDKRYAIGEERRRNKVAL